MKLHIERPRKALPPFKISKKYEFIDLSTSGNIPKNLINKIHEGYNSVIITNDDRPKEMIEILQYMYENGGVYIQNLNCSPDIFIKNTEMVVYNIHYFSCAKKSQTMKKIINEIQGRDLPMSGIINIFNKYTNSKYKFSKSISLLF